MMSSVIQFSESRSSVTCRNCNLGELLIVLPSACWCTRASPSIKKLGQTIGGVESVMYVASVGRDLPPTVPLGWSMGIQKLYTIPAVNKPPLLNHFSEVSSFMPALRGWTLL